ncbi:MAG: META domain-containing protein [Bacteroidetes bacterium]|nr:META domain-containing protein [Bacteroidota bacterium]
MKLLLSGLIAAFSITGYQAWTGFGIHGIPSAGLPLYSNSDVISCNPDVRNDSALLAGKWYLVPVLSSDTATGKIPTIIFDLKKKSFTGNTGCNSMNGRFAISGKSIQVDSGIVMTRMACPGYNEKSFIKSLLRVNSYKFEDGVLVLLFDGTELSRWTRSLSRPKALKA